MMQRLFVVGILSLSLIACAPTAIENTSELQQGQRDFDSGYYKRALHRLLPVACDGNAQAQYAVGYLYYYGYGAAQDTETGYFWIKRAADQHYDPAIRALATIDKPKS